MAASQTQSAACLYTVYELRIVFTFLNIYKNKTNKNMWIAKPKIFTIWALKLKFFSSLV